MAPMDGLELTRLIRTSEDSPDPFVPIIMLSGHVDRMRAARDAGVSEFMMKPVSVRTFLACLGAVVERPRPFVRANGYFGPDRRRMLTPFSGPDRRTQPHTY
jgi:DNA-binding response OmpR family regulator